MMQKKSWEKPKLIVFSRNRSEENVLAICKAIAVAGSAASFFSQQCNANPMCFPCFVNGGTS